MSLLPKIKSKLHQSGIRGVVASTLRFMANRIDLEVIDRKSQTHKPANSMGTLWCVGDVRAGKY